MSYISIKEAAEKILSKSEKTSDVLAKMDKKDIPELQAVLQQLSKKCMSKEELAKPGANAAATSIMNAFGGGGSSAPAPAPAPASGSLASNITSGLNSMIGKGESCKISEHGQWKIEKDDGVKTIDYSTFKKPKSTAKPGPTLDYSKPKSTIKPGPALDYSKPASTAKPGPAIDYSKNPKPSKWEKSPEQMQAASERINATNVRMKAKYGNNIKGKPITGVNKNELEKQAESNPVNMTPQEDKNNVLEKPPVSEAQRKAMWAAANGKSNLGIPQSVGKDFADADQGGKLPEHKKAEGTNEDNELKNAGRMVAKDDKEPHKDDPRHEAKEQEKAKHIKEDAQEILDLHKNGQWSLTKAKFISPDQQKANKAKSMASSNQAAAKEAKLDVKMASPVNEPSKKPVDKKHLTVIKEEGLDKAKFKLPEPRDKMHTKLIQKYLDNNGLSPSHPSVDAHINRVNSLSDKDFLKEYHSEHGRHEDGSEK